MSGLISETTAEPLQGTDQALATSTKPAVEVTFEVAKPSDGRPLDPDTGRANRIAAGIRKMRELGSATGKVDPLKVEKVAEPGKDEPPKGEAAPAKAEEQSAPPAEEAKPEERDALDAKPGGGEDKEGAEEPAAEDAPADPPAEEAKPEGAAAEAKPDPVELATLKADLAEREREMALIRADLDRARGGGPSDDERTAWIENPIGTLRERIASVLGVKPDSKEVTEELAHLQRELTIEHFGVDNLPDERKHQRITEQTSRRWQLTQQVRTASQETAKQAQQRKQVVEHVASVVEAAKDEYPFAVLAPDVVGRSSAEAAVDLFMSEARAGRVQVTGDDAKDMREALRLLNDHVKTRLDRLNARQPKNTAPAPATAPAASKTEEKAPGAPAPQKSTAPKTGSATPKTLSATQAAAAPPAKKQEPPERKNEPITIDPHDRDGREKRFLQIGRKRLLKQQ